MDIQSESKELQKTLGDIDSNNSLRIISLLLIPFIIGIFLYIHFNNKVKELEKKKSDILISLIKSASSQVIYTQSIIEKIQNNDTYLTYQEHQEINNNLWPSLKVINDLVSIKNLLPTNVNLVFAESQNKIIEIQKQINDYNEQFVARRIKEYDYLFKKSPFPLDENQKRAVVIDDKHNLVVAGAGSGKTEVLITRIAYLIERKPDTIKPERILALAFLNKAANEMRDRLQERYRIEVKVKTFHALGKEVLEKSSSNPPKLISSGDNFDREYSLYINELYIKLCKLAEFQEALVQYIEYYGDDDKTEADFTKKQEYYQYMRSLTYTALDGVKVKSDAERRILNFFLTHTINGEPIHIIYEKPAEWMKYKDEKGKEQIPKPDFFLPQFDLYFEHWAIDEKGNVPEWFEGENPSEKYRYGMESKRARFLNQSKYRLIETYAYEFRDENTDGLIKERLFTKLCEKFPGNKFVISSLSSDEIINDAWCSKESIKTLPGNIATFITIAKTYNLSPEDVEKRLTNEPWRYKQRAFGKLALIVYKEYEKSLRSCNSIDFADMINLAVKLLKENAQLYANVFDHILIDEYQDISPQRYELIKTLMSKNDGCKLFCVGDDWQSIMGFTGSNVDYFVKFDSHFDHPKRTDLIMNYRSTKPIVDTGAAIIKGNGNVQLSKVTQASRLDGKAIKIFLIASKNTYNFQMVHHCVDTIEQLLKSGYAPHDIMILARIVNNPIIRNELLQYAQLKKVPISNESRKADSIQFMSVHKSKGLQARVVFILNVNNEMYGFPCWIEDPKIYEPAIVGRKKDRLEEERRLFYVAVTRAKEDVVIYAQKSSRSIFIDEISDRVNVYNI